MLLNVRQSTEFKMDVRCFLKQEHGLIKYNCELWLNASSMDVIQLHIYELKYILSYLLYFHITIQPFMTCPCN